MEYLGLIGGVIALVIILKLLSIPFKIAFKLLINAAIGMVILFGYNYLAGMIGFIAIPMNLVTTAIVGLLGIPGIIALIGYFLLF